MSIHELYYFARGRNEVGGVNQPILVYLVMEENEGHAEGSLLVVNDNSAKLDVSMLFSSSNLCSCSASVHLLAYAAKLVAPWVCAQGLGYYSACHFWLVMDLQKLVPRPSCWRTIHPFSWGLSLQ